MFRWFSDFFEDVFCFTVGILLILFILIILVLSIPAAIICLIFDCLGKLFCIGPDQNY